MFVGIQWGNVSASPGMQKAPLPSLDSSSEIWRNKREELRDILRWRWGLIKYNKVIPLTITLQRSRRDYLPRATGGEVEGLGRKLTSLVYLESIQKGLVTKTAVPLHNLSGSWKILLNHSCIINNPNFINLAPEASMYALQDSSPGNTAAGAWSPDRGQYPCPGIPWWFLSACRIGSS